MSLDAELFKRICPTAYYRKYLENDVRPDGRDTDTARGIIVSDGHISTADGSSFVRLGNTGLICGVKLEYKPAASDAVVAGMLDVNVMITPICSPDIAMGKPTSQSIYYGVSLKRIFERYVIDLKELYAAETKGVFVLHADIVCIDYEGSILDACFISLLSALKNTRIPNPIYQEDSIVFDHENCRKLTLLDVPVGVTFGLMDNYTIIDPDAFEEDSVEDMVTIVLGKNGFTLSVLKNGGKTISEDIIQMLTVKARERYNLVTTVLEQYQI